MTRETPHGYIRYVSEVQVTILYRGDDDIHSSGLKWTEMHDDSAE